MSSELAGALARVAQTPELLVVCDFDGVLAPIVAEPGLARPLPQATAAIEALLALPHTAVALVSGRALADLSMISQMPPGVHLVGSHGAEFESGWSEPLTSPQMLLRQQIREALEAIVKEKAGVSLEAKPASIAMHTRLASREVAADVIEAARQGPATWTGVHVMAGKEVLEFSVVKADKGQALESLRRQLEATAVVFLGDDVTDETAFARLIPGDVGIKVGPGQSQALYRVPDPPAAARVLRTLAEARRATS